MMHRAALVLGLGLAASTVARADDAVVGTGTPASCTEAAFNAALAQVVPGVTAPGGRLSFNCGAAAHTIALTSSKFLSDEVTIDGGGTITLDGQDLTRLFTLSVPIGGRTVVSLEDLTLARGFASADFGGAILANGGVELALTGVLVRDSRAGLTGGGIAIAPGGRLTVTNSRFERNRARDGGAIAASCDVAIVGSTFFNNDAEGDQGGALQIWTSTLTVGQSRFDFNSALNGGAILQRGGTATLDQVTFSENQARDRGGAYHVYESGQTAITRGTFSANSAVNDGGAVYVAGLLDAAATDQTIGSRMQITGSDLDGNRALRAGGGAYVFGLDVFFENGLLGELRLIDTRVRNNSAPRGGGVYNRGALHTTDVTISGNQATDGGGLYLPQTRSLAAIPVALLRMIRTTISNNVASATGGGIWKETYSVSTDGVVISGNQARDGGGIAQFNGGLEVFARLALVGNRATRWGGGLYIDYSFGTVIQAVTFSGNQATSGSSRGGDLYVAATGAPNPPGLTQVILQNVTLIGSVANQGSTVYATEGADVRLQRSILFPLIGGACQVDGNGVIRSDGANLLPVAGCPTAAQDQTVGSLSDLGLSALVTLADGSQGYLPAVGSIALERQTCDAGLDQRGLPRPVDVDADGFALCDAGAVERQVVESGALFGDGFE
jgi:predicted outer membrane repeat protein